MFRPISRSLFAYVLTALVVAGLTAAATAQDTDSNKPLSAASKRALNYYKGEIMGEQMTFGGREIKWGVAIADRP